MTLLMPKGELGYYSNAYIHVLYTIIKKNTIKYYVQLNI